MSNDFSRRYFLKVLAVGAATSAGVMASCSSNSNNAQAEPVGDIKAGNVSALAVGQVNPVPGSAVFIGRDNNGVYAMTTTCTHQGCDLAMGTISTSAMTITCPCHNSQFNFDGGVVAGPATSPLAHYAVDVATDGTITVHGGTKVDASTRTPA
jgi:Rieske Fe-S protein